MSSNKLKNKKIKDRLKIKKIKSEKLDNIAKILCPSYDDILEEMSYLTNKKL